MDGKTIPGGKALLFLRPDGLLQLTWQAGVDVLREDASAAVEMINKISADRDRPLLVDIRGTGSATSGARDVFGTRHAASMIALIGESPVDRVIANFFIGVRKPVHPTRFFTSEARAVEWLKEGLAPADGRDS